jgi:hypothetical protein
MASVENILGPIAGVGGLAKGFFLCCKSNYFSQDNILTQKIKRVKGVDEYCRRSTPVIGTLQQVRIGCESQYTYAYKNPGDSK